MCAPFGVVRYRSTFPFFPRFLVTTVLLLFLINDSKFNTSYAHVALSAKDCADAEGVCVPMHVAEMCDESSSGRRTSSVRWFDSPSVP